MKLLPYPWTARKGTVARLFSHLGQYPEVMAGNCGAGFLYTPEAAVMAVHFNEPSFDEVGYSEMRWAKAEEICLLASLSLARNVNEGVIIAYPMDKYFLLDVKQSMPLNDKQVLIDIKELLLDKLSRDTREIEAAKEGRSPPLPPFLSGTPYRTCGDAFIQDRHERLLKALRSDDHLMVRGLSTLLRSYIVASHHHLVEEATLMLYVSLEASFRLVLRRLKGLGNQNPSAKDAAAYVAEAFDEPPLDRYFEEYYDDRVMTLHPESRFGIFPHAPLCMDDCYDLQAGLCAMYGFLICGDTNYWTVD